MANALQQAYVELSDELEKQLDNAVVSDEGEVRQSWLAQLDTLTRANRSRPPRQSLSGNQRRT